MGIAVASQSTRRVPAATLTDGLAITLKRLKPNSEVKAQVVA
jgi:hypothetical protein